MTRRTKFGTFWGITLTLAFYILSVIIGFSWGFSPSVSVAVAIISGGLMGIIIGSNEMAPSGGAITGAVTEGLVFMILGSFTADIGSPVLFFIEGILLGSIIGFICSIFVHKVSFK